MFLITKQYKRFAQIALLLLVLIAGSILAYQPHFDYPYPILGDEYGHISLAKYVQTEKSLPFGNPYFAASISHVNFEAGFDILLAVIFSIIPADLVLFYKFIVIAFFLSNALLLFYLTYLWFKNYWIALSATFFFSTIKSGAAMLAHQYVVPLSFGITLLLLAFIFFHLWSERQKKRYLFLFLGTLATLAFSYPPALLFVLLVLLIYIPTAQHSLHNFFQTTKDAFLRSYAVLVALLSALAAIAFSFFDAFEKIIFPFGWSATETHYSFIFFFGIIPTFFAIFGLYKISISRNTPKIILYWFAISFVLLLAFYFFDASVLIPTPRLFMFYLIGVSILAGVGAYTVMEYAKQFFSSWRAICAVKILLIALLVFHYSITFAKPIEFHKIITPENYNALIFLKETYPEPGIIIADSATSLAVYPVAGKYVLGTLSANIGGGSANALHLFLGGTCKTKIEQALRSTQHLAGENGFNSLSIFAISTTEQPCPTFMDLVYNKTRLYVYELHLSNSLTGLGYSTLAGNTLEGNEWVEYYEENGAIRGRVKSTGKTYEGTWTLQGRPRACSVFPLFDPAFENCPTISIRGNSVRFFKLNGPEILERSATRLPGNPFNL